MKISSHRVNQLLRLGLAIQTLAVELEREDLSPLQARNVARTLEKEASDLLIGGVLQDSCLGKPPVSVGQ